MFKEERSSSQVDQSWEEFVKNFNVKQWENQRKKAESDDEKGQFLENVYLDLFEQFLDECVDMHPACKKHGDLCEKDTYVF